MTNKILIVEHFSNNPLPTSTNDTGKVLGTMSTIPRIGEMISFQNVFFDVIQVLYDVKDSNDEVIILVMRKR